MEHRYPLQSPDSGLDTQTLSEFVPTLFSGLQGNYGTGVRLGFPSNGNEGC
jgi:hypothetical protein